METAASPEIKAQRMRMTLELLEAAGGTSTHADLWEAIEATFPPRGDEHEMLAQREVNRAQSYWIWSSTNMVKSGWLKKDGHGAWSITDAGRDALTEHQDPREFETAAREGYTRWNQAKQAALGTKIMPLNDQHKKVIEAAEYFVQRALAGGESVFAPGRFIWTPPTIDEVYEHFVEATRTDGSFIEQLESQFADASDDARLLLAELVTLQLLPASLESIGEAAKHTRVSRVLGTMDHPVVIPREISDAFGSGSLNMGQLLAGHIVKSLELLVHFAAEWVRLEPELRDQYLGDPWEFRGFVMGVGGPKLPAQRLTLLYLVHPDTFGIAVSSDARKAIREAFTGEIGESSGDLDRDLLHITIALQQKNRGPVDFFAPPLWDGWHKTPAPDPSPSPSPEPDPPIPVPKFAIATDELATALHVDTKWLQNNLDLLERRRQLIFFGPPGTGKTYIAKALAKHATGQPARIVQFHPSYSYEDFVEGYRPAESDNGMVYRIKPGPFLTLAREAEKNPEQNYVLVIDEINRGNIAKVFGELYFLLEYRDEPMQLLYGETEFRLPSNVFIIGTMNTSDRSIALLDAAMRRRFAFVELHPDEAPIAQVLPAWLRSVGLPDEPARLLAELNSRIVDPAYRVGPSYLMPRDADLSEERLREIWAHDILPLLAEAHYGEDMNVSEKFGLDALRAALKRTASLEDSDGGS